MSINRHIKILKYIMYFLIIISMIFGVIDKANALQMESWNFTTNDSAWTLMYNTEYMVEFNFKGSQYAGINFINNYNNTTYDYLLVNTSMELYDNSYNNYISLANIDWQTTCTNTTFNYDIPDFYVHYADGTTSTIDGDLKKYYCNEWNTTGTIPQTTINESIIDLNPSIGLGVVYSNNSRTWCNNSTGTIWTCPIMKNIGIKGLYITATNSGKSATYRFKIKKDLTFYNGEANEIITSQNQNTNTINNSIQDTNNTLKDSSIDTSNTSLSTSAWNNKNASNGTITNLLTLPIQLMQGYVNGMNSSCTPFNLGDLFGTTIILPCINVGALIGSSIWSIIDVLFSGFMIFGIAKKLIKIFNDFTNMKSNQVDELYGGGA